MNPICSICGERCENYDWSKIIRICHHCRTYYRNWKELNDHRMHNSGIDFKKSLATAKLVSTKNVKLFIVDLENDSGWYNNAIYQ